MVGKGRRGIRIGCCCRGDVGGKAPPLLEKIKIVVERREKMVGYVRRGEESESHVDVVMPLEGRLHRFKKR